MSLDTLKTLVAGKHRAPTASTGPRNKAGHFITALGKVGSQLGVLFTILLGLVICPITFKMYKGMDMPLFGPLEFGDEIRATQLIFMMYLREIMLVTFMVSLLFTITSYGLLKRWRWARYSAFGVLGVGILYVLAGLTYFVSNFTLDENVAEQQFKPLVPLWGYTLPLAASLGVISVLIWIIWKLTTPAIRAEFVAAAKAETPDASVT